MKIEKKTGADGDQAALMAFLGEKQVPPLPAQDLAAEAAAKPAVTVSDAREVGKNRVTVLLTDDEVAALKIDKVNSGDDITTIVRKLICAKYGIVYSPFYDRRKRP